jgi:tetratricopeptide (TPR) repeat protein
MTEGAITPDRMFPFEELVQREHLVGVEDDGALNWIAQLVDLAGNRMSEDGLRKALAWCDELKGRNPGDRVSAIISYFSANAWANLSRLRHQREGDVSPSSWEQPEAEQQILCLRGALNGPGFAQLERGRQYQILTNLGNVLSGSGRFIEALECWGRVLALVPKFWMARGNRGVALTHYARALYDPGHQAIFLLFAHRDLEEASAPDPATLSWGDPAVLQYFVGHKQRIEARAKLETIATHFKPEGRSLGRSADERAYRSWCLRNTLFLNPLNDLAGHGIAAQDVLTLPDFVTSLDEPPVLIGFFNQMKQEFASARWEYYLGIQTHKPHFSDRRVLLYNTLDYPTYGLAVERVKSAYKYAYSLFDKIAFFLNHYLTLGIKPSQVSFRSIWREKNGDPIHPIREALQKSGNWPLRGLFWLSKDLFDERHSVTTDPDARALHELRTHLEHRYVKVHEMMRVRTPHSTHPDLFFDTLAYSISRASLEERTLRLLKLVRGALIYLALAMHREEHRRHMAGGKHLVMPMNLDHWDDSWKT